MGDRLDGKVAIVTGGAAGIGAGTVQRLHEEGARVVIADLQAEKGMALADRLGQGVRFIRTDVTQEADIEAAVALALADFGGLDIMVNNAGILGAIGPLIDTPVEAWDLTMAVDLKAVFLGIKHAGRVMTAQKSGSIISLASNAGLMAGLGPAVYTAAKHGVVGLTRAAAAEFAQHRVRVNAVAPGGTVTELSAASATGDVTRLAETEAMMAQGAPLGRACLPRDIANAILFLATDEAAFVTGHTLCADAGSTTGNTPPLHAGVEQGLMREAGKRG
jgi:NAD(P)-dependent dehydrogenase (short-subunit alcohol dehydrogenase family)